MSDTPRTDAHIRSIYSKYKEGEDWNYVETLFARQLEQELTQAKEALDIAYLAGAKDYKDKFAEARELLSMLQIRGNELYNDNWQYERDYFNEVKDFLERTEK